MSMSIHKREQEFFAEIDAMSGDRKGFLSFSGGIMPFEDVAKGLVSPSTYKETYNKLIELGHIPKEPIVFTVERGGEVLNRAPRFLPECIFSFENKSIRTLIALHLTLLGEVDGRTAFMPSERRREEFLEVGGHSEIGVPKDLFNTHIAPCIFKWDGEDEDVHFAATTLKDIDLKQGAFVDQVFWNYYHHGIENNGGLGHGYNEVYIAVMLSTIARLKGPDALVALHEHICDWLISTTSQTMGAELAFSFLEQLVSVSPSFKPYADDIQEAISEKLLYVKLRQVARYALDGSGENEWLSVFNAQVKEKYKGKIENDPEMLEDFSSPAMLLKASCGVDYLSNGRAEKYFPALFDFFAAYEKLSEEKATKAELEVFVLELLDKVMKKPDEFASYLARQEPVTRDALLNFILLNGKTILPSSSFVTSIAHKFLAKGNLTGARKWLSLPNQKQVTLDIGKLVTGYYREFDAEQMREIKDLVSLMDTKKEAAFFTTLTHNGLSQIFKKSGCVQKIVLVAIYMNALTPSVENIDAALRKANVYDIMVKMYGAEYLLPYAKGATKTKLTNDMGV
jgi:hypothetical protein